MASNVRMKIAAGATVLGLGGLAGYALAANDGQPVAAGQAAREARPKVHTEVVHRTIHVRPKGRSDEIAAGPAGATSGPAPGLPAVAVTPVSDTSGRAAPSTGTSGGPSSSDESDDYGENESDDDHGEQADDQGEHESDDYGEHEIEVGDD